MIVPRRSVIALIVAALLLVPALARAQQVLDVGRAATVTSSFSRSVDVPPDTVSVAPDLSVTLIDVDAVLHPIALVFSFNDRLPDPPDLRDTDSLRGPPC